MWKCRLIVVLTWLDVTDRHCRKDVGHTWGGAFFWQPTQQSSLAKVLAAGRESAPPKSAL